MRSGIWCLSASSHARRHTRRAQRRAVPDFAEFIEYSKKKPGQVSIGHPGAGSVGDFCVQLINALTGAELVPVPYAARPPPSPLCAENTSKASCCRSVR